MSLFSNRSFIVGLLTSIYVLIFVIDLYFSLGVAGIILYIFPVFIASQLPEKRSVILAALVSSAILMTGIIYASPEDVGVWVVVLSRSTTLLVIWMTAGFILLNKQTGKDLRESEERLKLAIEGTKDGIWDWDIKNDKLWWSPRLFEMHGYQNNDFLPSMQFVKDSIHPEDKDKVEEAVRAHLEEHDPFSIEFRKQTKSKEYIWIHGRAQALWDEDGKPVRMVGFNQDVTERKLAEMALKNIADGFSSSSGEEIFKVLTKHLGDTLDVDFVIVGSLVGKNADAVKSMAIYHRGQFLETMKYDLKDTPCETVIGKTCKGYSSGVQKKFPCFSLLADLEIEGYVGSPLFDSKGHALGIIVVLNQKPIMHVEKIESLVQIFAVPVATELERTRYEKDLQDSEKKFKGLVETAPDALAIINNSGKIEIVNEQLEKITGFLRQELIGHPIEILIPERFKDHRQQRDGYIVNPHVRIMDGDLELYIRRKDGSEFPVEISLSPLDTEEGLIVSAAIRDITERKQAEEVLQANERRLRNVIDSMSTYVCLLTTNGIVIEANNTPVAKASLNHEDIIGSDFAETYWWSYSSSVQEQLREALRNASEGKTIRYDAVVRMGEDQFNTIDVTFGPLYNDYGEVVQLIGSAIDITDRKLTEQRQRQLEQQLFRSQKMDSIGELTGGIAHDFNNILAGILGYTRLASRLNVGDSQDKLTKYLSQIQHGGERARDMIKQMLTFSREGPGEISLQSLQPLIENTLQLFRSTLSSNIEIQVQLTGNISEVLIDPVQFEQVIMNLCINARDAIEENGVIEIDLTLLTADSEECDSCHELISDNYVCLSIKDTGSGIAEEIQTQIFDPFYSTKGVGKGTGMGLSMVHGIMHNCDGHIQVESSPGKGTTFRLLFPIIEDTSPLVEETHKKDERNTLDGEQKQGVIMLIDDEPLIADSLGEILKSYGYDVITSTCSEDALKTFRQAPDVVNLVITDQTMPGITGLELAKKILELRPGIPIIISTGYSEQVNEENAKKVGIRTFLQKPIDVDALLDTIDELLIPEEDTTTIH